MTSTIRIWGAALIAVVCAALPLAPAAASATAATGTPAASSAASAARSVPATPVAPARSLSAAAVATPAQAVTAGRTNAAANGVNQYLCVVDRATGAVLAQYGSGTQVASESIMKLMLAAYYLVLVGGYQHESGDVLANLSYMIRYSDDDTANAYFTSSAIPTIAARYGMRSTINATDRVGHWGAARITAADMTTFLYRAGRDPQVGPWLLPVMAQVAPVGSDGFDQSFGMNSLSGTHGSKQGWGSDEFWSDANNVINSVGYTDRYYVAILQHSNSYPDPDRSTSTYAARAIAASRPAAPKAPTPPPLRNGDFVRLSGYAPVYRLAGGAPVYVSSWAAFGGGRPVRVLSSAQWRSLRSVPLDGTYLAATGTHSVYRVVGGAPVYVANWAHVGGSHPPTVVDASAIAHAGAGTVWSHLRARVPDGTFLRTLDGSVYRVAGGAPIYVSNWSAFGGSHPVQLVDFDAVSHAGFGGVWKSLLGVPADGTYLSVNGSATIFRVAGGAPLFVSSRAPLGRASAPVKIDLQAVVHAGQAGKWAHLRFYPASGTFVTGEPTHRVYRVIGGRAHFVPSWAPYGGPKPTVGINQPTIDRAGTGGAYNHLKR